MLNTKTVSDHLKVVRIVLLSKNGKTTARLDDIRPIVILTQLMKVLEKTIQKNWKAPRANCSRQASTKLDYKRPIDRDQPCYNLQRDTKNKYEHKIKENLHGR